MTGILFFIVVVLLYFGPGSKAVPVLPEIVPNTAHLKGDDSLAAGVGQAWGQASASSQNGVASAAVSVNAVGSSGTGSSDWTNSGPTDTSSGHSNNAYGYGAGSGSATSSGDQALVGLNTSGIGSGNSS